MATKSPAASNTTPKARFASPSPPFTRCSIAWKSSVGFAARGKPAPTVVAAVAIASRPPERKDSPPCALNGPNSLPRFAASQESPMPDWQKPDWKENDWKEFVRTRLADLALDPVEKDEVQ